MNAVITAVRESNVQKKMLFSHSVRSDSSATPGLERTRLLCSWDFPGRNTGVGSHFLLQGIFLIQGLNLCLLHWQADSLLLSHQGSPHVKTEGIKNI